MTTGNEPPVPADEPTTDGGQTPATPTGAQHGSTGRYITTLAHDERAAAAARMKADHPRMTYQQIADAVGYSNKGDCWRAIDKCRKAVLQSAGAALVASEAALLDDMFAEALEVLDREHLVVSHGKVVTGEDGKPLLDDGVKLATLREMRYIRESYRKLFGADQPTQVTVSGSVKYEVVGVESSDLT